VVIRLDEVSRVGQIVTSVAKNSFLFIHNLQILNRVARDGGQLGRGRAQLVHKFFANQQVELVARSLRGGRFFAMQSN
jgi:hypothetical protein